MRGQIDRADSNTPVLQSVSRDKAASKATGRCALGSIESFSVSPWLWRSVHIAGRTVCLTGAAS